MSEDKAKASDHGRINTKYVLSWEGRDHSQGVKLNLSKRNMWLPETDFIWIAWTWH